MRIRVEASGVNFADVMGRFGTVVPAIFLMFWAAAAMRQQWHESRTRRQKRAGPGKAA
jgi:hypothetical protein